MASNWLREPCCGALLGHLVAVSLVEHVLDLLWHFLQHVFWEDAQQLPSHIQRSENITFLVRSLSQKSGFKLLQEFQVQVVIVRQSFLSNNGFHCSCVDADGVVCVHLIRDVGMINSSHPLADARLHQSGQRWQHVNRRVDLPVVQTAVNKHLPLGDVAGQIRDRMGDVIVGHGQDRELCDRSVPSLNPSGTFVDCSQIGVHVPRITTAARHLLSGSGDLSKSVGVGGHVSQDHKDMLLALVCEILGSGQRQPGGNNALNSGIVG
mmetsp:Transcript_39085/g.89536  ORF Transcript_39085/g.89536 Transcript_39085/m.89536 type:complete len:265 (-) Transcript_39085:762-1556(-)